MQNIKYESNLNSVKLYTHIFNYHAKTVLLIKVELVMHF